MLENSMSVDSWKKPKNSLYINPAHQAKKWGRKILTKMRVPDLKLN
jgi:hypothetical protein